jgi:hypothetical protein
VTTVVGTLGAVIKVLRATLRIPEDALRDGKDIAFTPTNVAAPKGSPARVGGAFTVGPAMTSVGAPFELTLPFPADTGKVVLLVVSRGAKDGKPTTEVRMVAPKRFDPGKGEAFFELPELPEGDVSLAKRPTDGSAPEESAPSPAGSSGPSSAQ